MLSIFFQALLFTLVLLGIFLKIFSKRNRRWGGVVLITIFIGLVLARPELELTRQLKGLLVGSGAILIFGIWDDRKNLSWRLQLLFQTFLVGLLIYFGFQVDYLAGWGEFGISLNTILWRSISIFSALFIFFWVVGVINAINWLDGIDSSMGAISLLGGVSVVLVSFLPEVNQPAIGILASIFLGIMVGFLYFNLPPAKIEAGTSGSYFVGFILAGLAIIAGSKIITIMIVLILPLLDFIWVIGERITKKQSIFKKDKKHLHYKLRKIGWSDRKIFLSYFIFLGSILFSYSLLVNRIEKILLLLVEIVALLVIFWWIRQKISN